MRRARHKSPDDAYYHVLTRVGGSKKYYPLRAPEARDKLIEMLYFYIRVYSCTLVAFQIMGNHYHFIAWMQKFCPLSREQLEQRAFLLWGDKAARKTASWSDEAWERFNRKLFDLSALMQHINGEYAKWYNRRYGRRGHFWADRFKNPELLDLKALQDCLLYIETNATRARLVKRPEQCEASSAYLRQQRRDENLMPIEQIFPDVTAEQSFKTYRERLEIRRQQDALKSPTRRKARAARQRFFSDGIAIGSKEKVARLLEQYRDRGLYRRRKHPIPQEGGLYSLREQRSHARS